MYIVYNSTFTELTVATEGEDIQIQAQGTCTTFNGEICIAPGGSDTECYRFNITGLMRLMEMGYSLNFTCRYSSCFETTVRQEMNNTVYTVFCSRTNCSIGSILWVGATSKLIVAGK